MKKLWLYVKGWLRQSSTMQGMALACGTATMQYFGHTPNYIIEGGAAASLFLLIFPGQGDLKGQIEKMVEDGLLAYASGGPGAAIQVIAREGLVLAKDLHPNQTVIPVNSQVPVATEQAPSGALSDVAAVAKVIVPCLMLFLLSGCAFFGGTPTAGETTGQLFCKITQSSGASFIAMIVDDAPIPGIVSVVGIASDVVADECNKAAAKVNAVAGVPVPDAPTTQTIPITPPAQTPAIS